MGHFYKFSIDLLIIMVISQVNICNFGCVLYFLRQNISYWYLLE